MQRREVIKSTGGVALLSAMPVSHFSQTPGDLTNILQTVSADEGLIENIGKLKTQTTIVKCRGKEVKIHAIQTGSVAVKRAHRSNRTAHFLTPIKISLDKNFTEFMPIWTWAIEHPEGTVVIDTGENADVMNPDYFNPAGSLVAKYSKRNFKFEVSKENEIGCQLRKLGISNDSIKNVVLTHLHIDHTDGIKDFRNVEIIVNEQEYKQPSSHFPELIPKWFKPKTVKYQRSNSEIFKEAYPLTGSEDLFLIPTNGHTKHHSSVLFKTDECDILFAGDVCYNQRQLIENDLPGINANYKESKKTFEKIKAYAKTNNLVFLPSHDSDSGIRLMNKTKLELK